MKKRTTHLSIAEEIVLYTDELIEEINNDIEKFKSQEKMSTRLNLVKSTDKAEILGLLFDKMSFQLVENHIKEFEQELAENEGEEKPEVMIQEDPANEFEDSKSPGRKSDNGTRHIQNDAINIESAKSTKSTNNPRFNQFGYSKTPFGNTNNFPIQPKTRQQQIVSLDRTPEINEFGYTNALFNIERYKNSYTKRLNSVSNPQHQQENENRFIQAMQNRALLQDNPFNKVLGDPEVIAQDLIIGTDIVWPTIPWHDGKVDFNVEETSSKLKRTYYESFIQSLPYVHTVGAFITVYLMLMFGFLAIETLESPHLNHEYFLREYAFPPALWFYGIFSYLFPITISAMKTSYFNFTIDNVTRYTRIIKNYAKLHVVFITSYLIYIIIGSLLPRPETYDYGYGYEMSYYYNTVNHWRIEEFVLISFIPTFLFYYFVAYFFKNINSEDKKIKRSEHLGHKFAMIIYIFGLYLTSGFSSSIMNMFIFVKYDRQYMYADLVTPIYGIVIILFVYNAIIMAMLKTRHVLRSKFDWYNDMRDFNILISIAMIFGQILLIPTFMQNQQYSNDDYYYYGRELTLGSIITVLIFVLIYLTAIFFLFDKIYFQITRAKPPQTRVTLGKMGDKSIKFTDAVIYKSRKVYENGIVFTYKNRRYKFDIFSSIRST
ncbi:MAG: hypothetical protein INQ03_14105 [Candidatus Heimdallarchaeota archaeon]|nr:hypothetical protein [Candidatus Heimdallarchaeota archaeon]